MPDVRRALEAGAGADDDDRAAAGRPQVGDGGLDRVPHAGQVDVDHVLPGLLAQFLGPAEADDAGVGDHDVEPAELGDPVVERRLQRVVVADVDLGGDDAPVERLDLLDRLLQVLPCRHRERDRVDLRRDVDGDDVGALLRQPDGVAAALTPGGPGDEGDLSF